jgi:hypothetical protein
MTARKNEVATNGISKIFFSLYTAFNYHRAHMLIENKDLRRRFSVEAKKFAKNFTVERSVKK